MARKEANRRIGCADWVCSWSSRWRSRVAAVRAMAQDRRAAFPGDGKDELGVSDGSPVAGSLARLLLDPGTVPGSVPLGHIGPHPCCHSSAAAGVTWPLGQQCSKVSWSGFLLPPGHCRPSCVNCFLRFRVCGYQTREDNGGLHVQPPPEASRKRTPGERG